MELLDIDKLRLFLSFVVPGLVVLYVRAQFLTGRLPAFGEGVVAYVAVSCVYYAFALPLLIASQHATGILLILVWITLTLIGPALMGFLLGLNIRKGWTQNLLAKYGIGTIHPVDTAWDWRFAGKPGGWVMAVLKDGTKWFGYLGTNSFLSSRPAERDIFIQQVYEVDENNTWTPRVSGVWIAHGELQSLEIWPDNQQGEIGNDEEKRI